MIEAAWRSGVHRLLFLGSSCLSPKHAEQPIREETQTGAPSVTCWGTGRPLREFLHVDDLGEACVFALARCEPQAARAQLLPLASIWISRRLPRASMLSARRHCNGSAGDVPVSPRRI